MQGQWQGQRQGKDQDKGYRVEARTTSRARVRSHPRASRSWLVIPNDIKSGRCSWQNSRYGLLNAPLARDAEVGFTRRTTLRSVLSRAELAFYAAPRSWHDAAKGMARRWVPQKERALPLGAC
eukprot:scaffold12692_cov67-Phaeocystis_antarctica.AAC.2